jgi:outer membrane receptor protein involved in Fe transport
MIEKKLAQAMRLMFTGTVVASAVAFPAHAQEKKAEKVETVVITGTRITTPGTTSNSPISSLSAAEIQSSQPVAVEEFFKGLPAAVPAIGPGTNNGSGGAATIDLRGLGTNRTLVLINGRRLVPFNLDSVVDTNAVPVSLLSRVDIVTGGASVVYGADAVSGVVNFNLKKNFKGFEVNTSYGTSDKGDALRNRVDVTLGANLDNDKGNVVLSLGKTKVDPFTQNSRPWSQQGRSSTSGLVQGSATTVPAAITVGLGTNGTSTLTGAWQVDPAKGVLVQPVNTFNFNPDNYYNTGMDRSQATALANYKISDNFEAYTELFYTNSKVDAQLASTGTFATTFSIPIGNPFIPAGMRDQVCARQGIPAANCVAGNTTIVPMQIDRRILELGPRYNSFDTKVYQYTLGLKGELFGNWNYDTYWSRGASDQNQVRKNWGSFAKMRQALNALNTTTCVVNSNGCVPFNPFGNTGSITPAMAKFINMDGISLQSITQDVASFSASGDLGNDFRSPWAKESINVSLSAEQRKMSASLVSDEGVQSGDIAGAGGSTPNVSGSFNLQELAAEAFIPVLKNQPFAKSLNFEIGYRRTEFKNSVQQRDYGSYKYGGEWAPVQTFRVRSMLQLATRAPNINELFAPAATTLDNLATDPCQGTSINAAQANTAGTLSNLCRLTGVPINNIGSVASPSAGQMNRFREGNPNLAPEEAKTKTIGFVFEPIPKMAVSLDYYTIEINKAIARPAIADYMDNCYTAKYNPSFAFNDFCKDIGRNTINGSLNGIEAKGVNLPITNSGIRSTSGYDLNVNYQLGLNQLGFDPKWGKLDLGATYNLVKTNLFKATPISINRDCLGYYSVSCGGPNYKSKFNQRTNWTIGDVTYGYNWRYVSAVEVEPAPGNTTKYLPAYSKINAYNYLDLSANWNFNKIVKLSLSITNATNRKPPFVGNTISSTGVNAGNTFPQFYDVVGRYYTLGATFKF